MFSLCLTHSLHGVAFNAIDRYDIRRFTHLVWWRGFDAESRSEPFVQIHVCTFWSYFVDSFTDCLSMCFPARHIPVQKTFHHPEPHFR